MCEKVLLSAVTFTPKLKLRDPKLLKEFHFSHFAYLVLIVTMVHSYTMQLLKWMTDRQIHVVGTYDELGLE